MCDAALQGAAKMQCELGQYASTFTWLIWAGLIVGALFFLAAPLVQRLMPGVK